MSLGGLQRVQYIPLHFYHLQWECSTVLFEGCLKYVRGEGEERQYISIIKIVLLSG